MPVCGPLFTIMKTALKSCASVNILYSNRYGKKATSTTMVRVGGLCVFKGLKRPTHKGPFREFSLVGAG